jgi:hypothetical protein
VVSVLALVGTLFAFTRFASWVEDRPGAVLDDPVLRWLEPRDLSVLTFAVIYLGLAVAIAVLAVRPRRIPLAVQTYVLLVWARMALMALTPLDPPAGLIHLDDPIVEGFGAGRVLTRDLFFSGHVGTGMVLYLTCPVRWARWVLLAAAVAVGALVLVQHVHYSVDVAVAPMAAFAAYSLARRWNR